MTDLTDKRVRITKGRDKDKFGIILEVGKVSSSGAPIELLIELNQGKIDSYHYEDIEVLPDAVPKPSGKYDNV